MSQVSEFVFQLEQENMRLIADNQRLRERLRESTELLVQLDKASAVFHLTDPKQLTD